MSAMPAGWAPVLARFARGEISAQVALAQLILANSDVDPVVGLKSLAQSDVGEHARLLDLATERTGDLTRVRTLVAAGIDPEAAETPAGRVAATRDLFDRLAVQAPEAAVAIYSLGDPDLLAAATAELVEVVAGWTRLDERAVLDFGCGIGRLSGALAPLTGYVTGIDVSPEMIRQARARAADVSNLQFEVTSGSDLCEFSDRSFDLILAVDSFPFLVRVGEELLHRQFQELARLLLPGGELIVFNWSYRGDIGADEIEAHRLAEAAGLRVLRAGERPFEIWDGVGFHFARL
jgi:SAM-dependent methyltransferase